MHKAPLLTEVNRFNENLQFQSASLLLLNSTLDRSTLGITQVTTICIRYAFPHQQVFNALEHSCWVSKEIYNCSSWESNSHADDSVTQYRDRVQTRNQY